MQHCQLSINCRLVLFLADRAEEIGIKRFFSVVVAAGATHLLYLLLDIIGFNAQQISRCIDPWIHLLGTMLLEAQHALVETAMPRVDFNEDVGAFLHLPQLNKNNMKQGC